MGRNYSSTSKSLNTTITHSHSALQFQSIWACAYHVCMVSASVWPPHHLPLPPRLKGGSELLNQNQMASHKSFHVFFSSWHQQYLLRFDNLKTLHYRHYINFHLELAHQPTTREAASSPWPRCTDAHYTAYKKKKGTRHWNDNKNIYSCRCKCITLISLFCFNIIGELRTKTIHLEFEFIFSVLSLLEPQYSYIHHWQDCNFRIIYCKLHFCTKSEPHLSPAFQENCTFYSIQSYYNFEKHLVPITQNAHCAIETTPSLLP